MKTRLSYLESVVIKPDMLLVIAPEVNLGQEESCQEYVSQAGNGDEEHDDTFLYLPGTNLSNDLGKSFSFYNSISQQPSLFDPGVPSNLLSPLVEILHFLAPCLLFPFVYLPL